MAVRQIFHEINTSKGKCNLRQVQGKQISDSEQRTTNAISQTQKNMQPACYFQQNEFRDAKSIKELPAATMVTCSYE
jgi:hypothetical protein